MKIGKWFQQLDRRTRIALAAGLIVATSATALAAVTLYSVSQTDRPTLLFRCMEFALREDGSIQAFVRISAENMERFASAEVTELQFNPDYIQPSYWNSATQRQVVMGEVSGLPSGKNLVVDPALYVKRKDVTYPADSIGEWPYTEDSAQQYKIEPGAPSTAGTPENGKISVYFNLNNTLLQNVGDHYVIRRIDVRGNLLPTSGSGQGYAIDAGGSVDEDTGYDGYTDNGYDPANAGKRGHGVNLGSMSFWVNPDKLTDMVSQFTGVVAENQTTGDGFLIGYSDKAGVPETNKSWTITDYANARGAYLPNARTKDNRKGVNGSRNPLEKEAQVVFEFIFPKILVKADVAGSGELTVNAWQAFTSGKIDDIAATLQRYRPEITGTNADATEENYIFHWGEANTTQHPENDYTVYRPALAGETPDYIECPSAYRTNEKWVVNGFTYQDDHSSHTDHRGWINVAKDPGYRYSPKEGEYMVTQYFYYMEDLDGDGVKETEKKYPLPMRVHLTVTPVDLVDANADKLTATYPRSQAGDTDLFPTGTLTALELPDQAVLGLSPVPGPVVLTMPIESGDWQPTSIGGLTVAGTPVQSQNWPAAGEYHLNGPDATKIKNYVETYYPWVTTDGFNQAINATRTVVEDEDYEGKEYIAIYVETTSAGILRLRVNKKDDQGTAENFTSDADFRTYLPSGTMIDVTTELPPTPAGNQAQSTKAVNNDQAELGYCPGTPGSRSSHQENVARSINLGGWFYVSVHEDGKWSALIPVYVSPRPNYYVAYEQPDGGLTDYSAAGGFTSNYYNFDFTGTKAGLYPFYSDSVVPEKVILPVGYTVTTTYDGITGAEPGQLGQFRVDQWASDEEGATPANTQPPWAPGSIVDYGDPLASASVPTEFILSTVYSGYGQVDNDANHEKTHVKVQVPAVPEVTPDPDDPDPTPPPTPEPPTQPDESILLTHGSALPQGNVTNDNIGGISWTGATPNEVKELTYTNVEQGYVDRQTFTLVIKNNGTSPIYGLAVHTDYMNGDSTAHETDGKPHFEIVKQPAAYLPAGGETTFTITYVYNLFTKNNKQTERYRDHLVITSNNSKYNQLDSGSDSQNHYLKDFYTQFTVTRGSLYKVTVVTDPTDGSLGTAKIIKGLTYHLPAGKAPGDTVTETGTANRPDLSLGTNAYAGNHEFVWIYAEPTDENEVKEVYYLDDTGAKVPLYIYKYNKVTTVPGDTDETAYFFKMPEMDVTVHVVFYEPIAAKLRLSRLLGFAGTSSDAQNGYGAGTGTGLIDSTLPITSMTSLDKWEHLMRHHVRWHSDSAKIIQSDSSYQDIVCPHGHEAPADTFVPDSANAGQVFCPHTACAGLASFDPQGRTVNNMTPDDSSRPARPDYIMVLGDYANTHNANKPEDDLTRVQLEARLRANSLSPDIDRNLSVTFSDITDSGNPVSIQSTPVTGKTWTGTPNPDPSAPTSHRTAVLEAPVKPADGSVSSKTVRITVSCEITQDMLDYDPSLVKDKKNVGDMLYRYFDVLIVRRGKVEYTLNYGNSPKGMIYNDSTLTTLAAKSDTWTDFVNNGNSFVGIHTPTKAASLKNTYWKEAWGGKNYWNAAAGAYENYDGDVDETALFVILGKPFQDPGVNIKNSAGLTVAASAIARSATVELLDTTTTPATQAVRFHGQRTNGTNVDTVTLNMGMGNVGLVTGAVTDVVNNWWQTTNADSGTTTVHDIRPGIYDLIYSFKDYDGTTNLKVERRLIVLSPVGDVDASRAADGLDVTLLQNRVTDPLGCMVTAGTPDYPAWRLFRYRCCDANNDRNINNIDANKLRYALAGIVDYYKPTDYRS